MIQNYLSETKQYEFGDNSVAVQRSTTCEVPQSSIAGPLLILWYINDLSISPTNCKIALYDNEIIFLPSIKPEKSKEKCNRCISMAILT